MWCNLQDRQWNRRPDHWEEIVDYCRDRRIGGVCGIFQAKETIQFWAEEFPEPDFKQAYAKLLLWIRDKASGYRPTYGTRAPAYGKAIDAKLYELVVQVTFAVASTAAAAPTIMLLLLVATVATLTLLLQASHRGGARSPTFAPILAADELKVVSPVPHGMSTRHGDSQGIWFTLRIVFLTISDQYDPAGIEKSFNFVRQKFGRY
jgi:hypothetical protein